MYINKEQRSREGVGEVGRGLIEGRGCGGVGGRGEVGGGWYRGGCGWGDEQGKGWVRWVGG